MSPTSPERNTILVVDDEPALLTLITDTLSPLGYGVLLAPNGERAYRLCQQHRGPIHLLITDMLMPAMNGLALAQKVQALHPETRILYLSGSEIVIGAFADEPGVAFLPKPCTMPDLINKVRELLRASR